MEFDSMKTTFIYALIDPRDGQIRYIGKTNNTKQRLQNHCNPARYQKTHKFNWIKLLRSKGLKPQIKVIEEIPVSQWKKREKYWIYYFKKQGCKLVNTCGGGEGLTFANKTSFKKGDNAIPVIQLTLKGEFIKEWGSVRQFEVHIGRRTCINHVLKGRGRSAVGFLWMKAKDYYSNGPKKVLDKYNSKIKIPKNSGQFQKGDKSKNSKKCMVLDLNNNLVGIFESGSEAARFLGVAQSAVSVSCRKGSILLKKYKLKYI
jgi:group I intron endonuclease